MQSNTKKEVSCKHLSHILIDAKNHKIDVNKLLEGVPYNISCVLNKHERIEWKYWCKILSNLRAFYTPLEYERIGREYIKSGNYIEGVLTAFIFFSSNKLARILAKQFFRIGDSDFTCIKHHIEYLAENRIRTKLYTEDEYKFCPEFYHLTKGAWDQFGQIIGHKEFKIDVTWIHQGVIFDVSWKKQGILFKIKRWWRWIFNVEQAVGELTESHEELLNQYNKLEESKNFLQKQTIQLKTAHNISTSIRQSLNIKDTLEAITNAFVEEAGFSAAFIKLNEDMDEQKIDITAKSGIVSSSITPIHQEVIINKKKIGELFVHPKFGMDYNDIIELLEYLLPVINIAIRDALVLSAIVDYRDNLETKVAERTIELQNAQDELVEINKLLKEAHQVQSRFFTNISHEFRTPLTLILGPVKQVIEKIKDTKIKEELRIVHKNANNLLGLVNQLLDISKLESGKVKLKTISMNVIPFFKALVHSFDSYAERKNIALRFISQENELIAYIDKDKIEKIIVNVLSNAFKFTPEGGQIIINVFKSDKRVNVTITDTGIGIPKEKIPFVFDRFYQVDGSHKREHEGTGIGLALTKELVDLHHGKIAIESVEGKGTTITVSLPLGSEYLNPEEICEISNGEEPVEDLKVATNFIEGSRRKLSVNLQEITYSDPDNGKEETILIVEDNSEVRNYIKDNLDGEYNILEAIDGEDGWNKTIDKLPDIIVSDVMMPKMDGFVLLEMLKTDERTSHIPVILLTAKAASQDKIEGYKTGADDYIMKPFDSDELKVRIKNLIQQRKRIQQHFQKIGIFDLDKSSVTSVDKIFLRKAFDTISRNVSDPSFSVESFAESLAVSRYVLYKKIVSLTGESPVELIRRIRLQRAAELIKKKFGNFSEIALEVGFNNPAYFSDCFKKQFGISPSHYQQKITSN